MLQSLSPSRDALPSPATSANQVIRLALLGCGGFMRRFYSPLLQAAAARIQVVCLCDLHPDNLRIGGLLFPPAELYAKPETMLEREGLDAVVVLTSEDANADMAEVALRANLPVYLEKPPARTRHEFAALRKAEDQSTAPLFVAFNRRHMPLLQGFRPPSRLRHIRGRMERQGRPFSNFPYTALHLIDSFLYLSGAGPTQVCVDFLHTKPSQWTLQGGLDNGATFELDIVPDGAEHIESLIFEGEDEILEIQFPNPESHFPVGQIIRIRNGEVEKVIQGNRNDALHEMGYAPAFRGFLELLEHGRTPSFPYQLSSCENAIAIMENMVDRL